ncbi:hypothetical protein ACA106_05555 [Agrobacterium pusense]|uniref:hypothetical protein n=1 Tax=Agrobacterium pusense TaxID=648995 RepID=UPI0006646D2E|nr:hypothetical protein [Agrobacterium pusense]
MMGFLHFGADASLGSRPQDALGHLAGGGETPERKQQLAGERHRHRLANGFAAVVGAFSEPAARAPSFCNRTNRQAS